MSTSIIVCTRVVGFHAWKDAPPEVDYLASRHRHVFTIKLALDVKHDDRDLEFHMVLRHLRGVLYALWSHNKLEVEFGNNSTEAIGRALIDGLEAITEWDDRGEHSHQLYLGRVRWIEVWEDDECGSRVQRMDVS